MFRVLKPRLEALRSDARFAREDLVQSRLDEALISNNLGRPRFTFIPAAVSSEDGELVLFGNAEATIRGGFVDVPVPGYDEHRVRMIDVVAWMEKAFGPDDVVVIKMDVEGAEHDIIPKLISSRIRVHTLAMECHDTGSRSCGDLKKLIAQTGMRVKYEDEGDYAGYT